jgi:UDP-N-acetylmuramyl pentapeptide phosphotransferase/UDP-N-acetylglucosamine-1-phosphate transferase
MVGMARGDHPMRTPVYGGLLVVAAMVGGSLVWVDGGALPGWLRTALLVLCLPVAVAGWLLTFRDATPARRRPPRS